jgi:hypothetical protein
LALKGLNNNTTTGYTYLYDQLNRLLNTRQHAFGTASGSFKGNWSQSNTGTTDNYAETFRYDANGNILQLNRNGNSQHPGGLAMDRLTYTYRSGTNQLWSVQDGIAAGAYAGDIDTQGGSNYSYDRIGNLIGDVSENISQVNWTVYGKIGNIQKKQAFLGYVYNAGGERVVKQYLPYATNQCAECPPGTGIDDLEVYERNSAIPETYKARKTITFLSEYTDVRYRDYSAIIEAGLAQCTPQCAARPPLNTSDADIYIRDATGNVLAVYHYDRKTSQLRWSEQHLYGSARLGMYLPEKSVISVSTDSKQREVGYVGKQVFELSNHLGNVLATITDKKLQVSTNTTSTAYFEADVQTVQDYYAFGMQMPGRKMSGGYRYGLNGIEKLNDVAGEGNHYTALFGEYDSRLAKRWNLDPKPNMSVSSYSIFENNPITFSDVLLDSVVRHSKGDKGVIVFGYGYEKDPTMKSAYDAAIKSKMSIIVSNDTKEMAKDFKTMNGKFDNVLFAGHDTYDDAGKDPTITLGSYSYNSEYLMKPGIQKDLKTIGSYINNGGSATLLGCFSGNDGSLYKGIGAKEGQYMSVGTGLAPISVFSIGLGNKNVFANQGATPISSSMFNNGGIPLLYNPKSTDVYYNLAKQFAGKWSMFNGYKFSPAGLIRVNEEGKVEKVTK